MRQAVPRHDKIQEASTAERPLETLSYWGALFVGRPSLSGGSFCWEALSLRKPSLVESPKGERSFGPWGFQQERGP